jgi:hypothetical protein
VIAAYIMRHAHLCRYHSQKLNWHFRPHSPTLFSTTINPEEGCILVKAQQLTRRLELKVTAPLDTFTTVWGPTRAGFVAHSIESYSATATAGGQDFSSQMASS